MRNLRKFTELPTEDQDRIKRRWDIEGKDKTKIVVDDRDTPYQKDDDGLWGFILNKDNLICGGFHTHGGRRN